MLTVSYQVYILIIQNRTSVLPIILKSYPSRDRKYVYAELSDETVKMHLDLAIEFNIHDGQELSDSEFADLKNKSEHARLKRKVHNYISYKPRTEKQISEYLAKEGANEEEIYVIINFLYEYNLINDAEYAKNYINDLYLKKPMGKNMAVKELIKRGIDRETAVKAANNITDEMEWQRMLDLIEKKYSSRFTKSLVEKDKVTKYLISRGFTYSDINKYFKLYFADKG
jgi:regulatory protein